MSNGYEKMSPRGRAVSEFVELATRLDIQKCRKDMLPCFPSLVPLEQELNKRYLALSELEKSAVIDLRGPLQPVHGGKRPNWEHWLMIHLLDNPNDAPDLLLLQHNFADSDRNRDSIPIPHHILQKYGIRDYPWRMQHSW